MSATNSRFLRSAVLLAKLLIVSERSYDTVEFVISRYIRKNLPRWETLKRDTVFEVMSKAVDEAEPELRQIREIKQRGAESFLGAAESCRVPNPSALLESYLGKEAGRPINREAIERAKKLTKKEGAS